jgi:hypothetical protein
LKRRLTRLSTGRVIFMCTAFFVVYFLATFTMNLIQSQQLDDEETRLAAEIAEMQSRYDRLQKLELYLNSDAYIESVAASSWASSKKAKSPTSLSPRSPPPPRRPAKSPPSGGRPWHASRVNQDSSPRQ